MARPFNLSTRAKEIAELFQQGLALHRQGQLAQARTMYERVLAIMPKHFDALHLAGVIAAQTKNPAVALELIGKAIEIDPKDAAAHSNIGLAFRELNRIEEAVASYDRAVAIKPDYAEAYSNRGIALKELKRTEEAVASYDRAIVIKPDYAEAHSNRGNALQELKRTEEAVVSYDRAIAIKPDYAEAYYNRGLALKILKRTEQAVVSYDCAIALKPDYAEAHYNGGIALKELKRIEEAVVSYERAIAIKPDYAEAYYSLGNALKELKHMGEAVASYERAIAIKPDYAKALYNSGIVLQEINRPAQAVASYDRAIAIKPDYAEAYANRGISLQELKLTEEAVTSYDRAIAIKPDYAEAYYNRGHALQELMRIKEAVASYDRAIAIRPDYASAYWNKSIALLLDGDFEAGWELFEWRWKDENILLGKQRNFAQPLWRGAEELEGKTILLHAEQGLGDSIQFCRYAKPVSDLGARVLLEVPQALIHLFTDLDGVAELIERGRVLPTFDYHCPLLSLPLAFKTKLVTIPSPTPYLTSNAEKRRLWEKRLGETKNPRIGIVWSGSVVHKNDHNRSLALAELVKHLPAHFEYVSLQREIRVADREALQRSSIKHYGNELNDFTETAALCDLMDIVVSVDTSVAHLAGALGKRTCVLLPYVPDWRWLRDGEDTPWYASVKLYRQDKGRDWAPVLERLAKDLS